MKIFKFFIEKIFLKKIVSVFGVLVLIFISDYLIFIAARSAISTICGYKEMEQLNRQGNYIANLDPNNDMNMGEIDRIDTQQIYDYLNTNKHYALFTDGFVVSLPNDYDMDVTLAYLNEEYYKLSKQFEISQGSDLHFDYTLGEKNIEIPVWIGKGLSKTYPLGSIIEVEDPALQKKVNYKVQGILKTNNNHSNLYSLSSKQYYNFSVVIPINEDFIDNSNVGFQLQGLYDIILLRTSENELSYLSEMLQNNLGLKFNFYTQEENFEYYSVFYFESLKFIAILTAIVTCILTILVVWSSLASIRLMIKDFTINLFVGLSYSKLRKIVYGYYGILFILNIVVLFIITVCSRYGTWLRKDSTFVTFGFLGVIGMDWLALLAVLLFDMLIGAIIVEIVIWKIKKVPISLGVLQ